MRTFAELSPEEFENFTFDLVSTAGLRNVVWRTPGADGGRDIEGEYRFVDFSGNHSTQKWYVECKRYASTLDWTTVWKKIAYAEAQGAEYLLMVTNSNPSPACETEIAKWNGRHRDLQVRFWRGYELGQIIKAYPAVAVKYGLRDVNEQVDAEFVGLMNEVMKASQAGYSALAFGTDPLPSLEAASFLSELASLRMEQVRTLGRLATVEIQEVAPEISWLTWFGPCGGWDATGLRALLAAYRYYTGAKAVSVEAGADFARLTAEGRRVPITPAVVANIQGIALWANVEIENFDTESGYLIIRQRK